MSFLGTRGTSDQRTYCEFFFVRRWRRLGVRKIAENYLRVTNPRRCAGQKGKELSLESGAIMGVTMRAGK
jgi:hypothetical protein